MWKLTCRIYREFADSESSFSYKWFLKLPRERESFTEEFRVNSRAALDLRCDLRGYQVSGADEKKTP